MQNAYILFILATFSIISSILVITSKNPVIAVIFLISVFINAACYLLILGVGFVGISYLILYVGAITVLFLFVIMLINIRLSDILESGSQYTKNIPLTFLLSFLFIFEVYNMSPLMTIREFGYNERNASMSIINLPIDILNNINSTLLNTIYIGQNKGLSTNIYDIYNLSLDNNLSNNLQIESLGHEIYSYGSVLLIISSIILLLAMIAPIFISRSGTARADK